jgi:hypothetical protein
MKPEKLPRIGGLPMHPLVDMALPMLFALSGATTVGVIAWAFKTWAGVQLLPGISVVSFLFVWESYLYTMIFDVREVDAPGALRWVEVAVMAILAYVLASLPGAAGFMDAVTGGYLRLGAWLGTALFAFAWWQGYRAATLLQYLHPALQTLVPERDRVPTNDHVHSFESIRNQFFGNVAVTAIVLGVAAWAQADVRLWGWSWLGTGLLVQAVLAAGAVLVAARLKQEMTWFQERLQAEHKVYDRWISYGLTLMIVPALLALLLPAGPRLPLEKLIALLPEGQPIRNALPKPPPETPKPQGMDQLLKQFGGADPGKAWHIPLWFWYLVGGIAVAWLLYAAAKQLVERVGRQELKGMWAILAVIAAWYLALFKAIGELIAPVLKQAVATPAQAVASLFGEAGALGRYLPFHGRAPADPRAAVRFYFARLQAEAGRKGYRRQASATAAEYVRGLSAAAPTQAGEIAELKAAYERARYSDEAVGAEEVSLVRRAWVAVVRAVGRKQ